MHKRQQRDEALSFYSVLSAARLMFFEKFTTLGKTLHSSLFTQPSNHDGGGAGKIPQRPTVTSYM